MKINARIDLAVQRLRDAGVDLQPIANAPWIVEAESKRRILLPASYRSLVTRYSFPTFDLGVIELFSNLGNSQPNDLTIAPFCDPLLSSWMVDAGYFQIGRPITGSYDPVCLDLRDRNSSEFQDAVVQLDHEDILMEHSDVTVTKVSPSFLDLLETGTIAP